MFILVFPKTLLNVLKFPSWGDVGEGDGVDGKAAAGRCWAGDGWAAATLWLVAREGAMTRTSAPLLWDKGQNLGPRPSAFRHLLTASYSSFTSSAVSGHYWPGLCSMMGEREKQHSFFWGSSYGVTCSKFHNLVLVRQTWGHERERIPKQMKISPHGC